MSKEAEDARLRELAKRCEDSLDGHGYIADDVARIQAALNEAIAPYAERIAELEQRRMVDESIIVDAAARIAALTEACAEAERLLGNANHCLKEYDDDQDCIDKVAAWDTDTNALLAKLAALGVGEKG